MEFAWPAWCTLFFLALLLIAIIRWQVNAFVALLVVSLGLGLAAGMPPLKVVDAIAKGVGDILRDVAIILALGAMLGRMLEASGGAEVIARTLVRAFGDRNASFAVVIASFLIGIPVLFNVGFLLLMPIMWQLQRETNRSLLYFLLPLGFSLGITHSLIPPHPGIVGAVTQLGGPDQTRTMMLTIVFGTLLSFPMVLIGWFGPGRWWAARQFVACPEQLAGPAPVKTEDAPRAGFCVSVFIVILPLVLSLLGFGVKVLLDLKLLPEGMSKPLFDKATLPSWLGILGHSPLEWISFLGRPMLALLIPTGLAFWLMGMRQGMSRGQLEKIANTALQDVGSMVFLFGAAGGFKEVIEATGAGKVIAQTIASLPMPELVSAYVVSVLVRMALGSATASILAASAVLTGLTPNWAGQETYLVLAVACGVTFCTQPADSGFWLLKEYGNLSVRDVMVKINLCRILMSLAGLGILLIAHAWLG